MKTALLIVDVQNDFLPGGPLGVSEGDQILPFIDKLISMPFDVIIATKDWHPANHVSFANTHGKKPGEHVQVDGIDQILWPIHCVQNTEGSEFGPGWDSSKVDLIVYKGTEVGLDSYSTFFDNKHLRSTGLAEFLKEKGVKDIYLAGVATDYCVKYSALDAIHSGFKPHIILEACRGVNLSKDDSKRALEEIRKAGCLLLHYEDIKDHLLKGKT